jgi:hypothetical protein
MLRMLRIPTHKREEAVINIIMETLCNDSSSSTIIIKGLLSYVEPCDLKDMVSNLSIRLRVEEPLLLERI